MKNRRRSRWLPWLICLGCVTMGGVGIFTNMGAPLRQFAADLFSGFDSDEQASSESISGNTIPGSDAAATDGRLEKSQTQEEQFDPHALPRGLSSIDGEAGEGLQRAVKKNGVWFPVYSQTAQSSQGRPTLNILPLAIASGPAPQGMVNEAYAYQSEAIGGTPPYRWEATMNPAAAGFTFEATSGKLNGISAEPITTVLALSVTDADGAKNSVQMPLVIRPAKALTMLTESLPVQEPEASLMLAMEAEGGVVPYRWSSSGVLPQGLQLEADGKLVGTTSEAGDFPLTITVTDQQNVRVGREMVLKVQYSLEILTDAALPSVAPGEAYETVFEASGGMEPYTWEITQGALPQGSGQLGADGILSGVAGGVEELSTFTLMVRDAEEATFQKTFRLAVSDLLTAIPSARKVGLAWSPAAVRSLMRGAAERFVVRRDEAVIYEGSGSNFVDHQVPTGASPLYELSVVMEDGNLQPIASKRVNVLPMSLQRGEAGVRGDPYVDVVTAYRPLSAKAYGASKISTNVTGPPDGRSTFSPATKATEVASLGATIGGGGFIELAFTDNIVELGGGEDLTVFENVFFIGGDPNQRFMEAAIVSVALFPGEWHRIPCDVLPPADGSPVNTRNPFYYARGIAGRNATTGEDPTDPNRSGGDSFNLEGALAGTGLTWIRFVRIQSTGDAWLQDDAGGDLIRHENDPAFQPLSGTGSSGFDLDAVCATRER